MAFTRKHIKRVSGWLIGLMIVGAFLAHASVAADFDGGGDATIRELQPFGLRSATETVRSQNVYDLVGNLNAIDGNQITIGNRQLTLDSGVSASGIAIWTEVGVNFNNAGQVSAIEIVSSEPH